MHLNLVTDLIKINLVDKGYLKDYPYHLISDEEMCDAFIDSKSNEGYFFDTYPLLVIEDLNDALTTEIRQAYDTLVSTLRDYMNKLKSSTSDKYTLPDWVLSYMLGSVISVDSSKEDIHDLILPLGIDNIDDEFTAEAQIKCYEISKKWVNKLNANLENEEDMRPPTIFGEPHVIKYIRLNILEPTIL